MHVMVGFGGLIGLKLKELAEQPRGSPFEPGALPTYLLLLASLGMVILTFTLTDFTYDGSMDMLYVPLLVMLLGGMGLRYLNLPRIGGLAEAIGFQSCIACVSGLGSTLIAATAFPLVDADLIRWDAALGFDWLALMHWLSSQPLLSRILQLSYHSLLWQTFLIVPALFIARQEIRCWTFLLAWSLALIVTLAIFPFFPAVGPIVYHHATLPGIPFKDGHMDVFMAVRDGTMRELGLGTIRGMVTMPSFHAAAAILLGWAFARVRLVGWAFVGLNIVMFLSAIPIGGHYLVDIIAGGVVALAAILLAKLILASRALPRRMMQAQPA